jgi:hypothetical protein
MADKAMAASRSGALNWGHLHASQVDNHPNLSQPQLVITPVFRKKRRSRF